MDPREQIELQIHESVHYIRKRIDVVPKFAAILGTGFKGITDSRLVQETLLELDYEDIPNFPTPINPESGRKLKICRAGGEIIVFLEGRFHLYEGFTMMGITMPVRFLRELGVETLILTNASGALNRDLERGDVVLIKDHINLMGTNPLVGLHDLASGSLFTDLSDVYSLDARTRIDEKVKARGGLIKQAIYVGVHGPSYETKAEVEFFRSIGGDIVGMSTVPEAIVAAQVGLKTIGISCVTNSAADQDFEGVAETTDRNIDKVIDVLELIIGQDQE